MSSEIARFAAVNNSLTSVVTNDHFCQLDISGNQKPCALTISPSFGGWSVEPIIRAASAKLSSLSFGENVFRTGYSADMDISGNDALVVSQATVDKILENMAANDGEYGQTWLHFCNVVLTGLHVSEPSLTGWGYYDTIWQYLYQGNNAGYSTLTVMGERPLFTRTVRNIASLSGGVVAVWATVKWIGYPLGGKVTFTGLDSAWADLETGEYTILSTNWDQDGEYFIVAFNAEGLDPCTSGTMSPVED
jgi:hypothetical protein